MPDGWELETGGRADLLLLDGDSELRAGPLIGVEGGARFEELRGYVGITYRATAISRRYDPIDSLFRDSNE